MVIDRQRRERRLRRVLEDLRGPTVQGVAERLAPYVGEDEDLGAAVDCLLGAVDGLLTAETCDLVAADDRNNQAGIEAKVLRRERDETARELRHALVEIRETAACFFGREAGNDLLGVEGPTARAHQPTRLISQVDAALERLRDPATELPEPRVRVGISDDLRRDWIDLLETRLTRFRAALEALEGGKRVVARARHTKGVRIELHDDELSAIANLQEALLILGRNRKAARSVWKRQRPVGRPARWKSRRSKARKRASKGSKATKTGTADRKGSSKQVASS